MEFSRQEDLNRLKFLTLELVGGGGGAGRVTESGIPDQGIKPTSLMSPALAGRFFFFFFFTTIATCKAIPSEVDVNIFCILLMRKLSLTATKLTRD